MFEIHYQFFHSKPISTERYFKEREYIINMLVNLRSFGYDFPLKKVDNFLISQIISYVKVNKFLTLFIVNTKTDEAITFSHVKGEIIIRKGSTVDKQYQLIFRIKLSDIKELDVTSKYNVSLCDLKIDSSMTLTNKDFSITI
jgi:hypothetical protein